MAWDPATYLAFGTERTRPAADLLARIPLEAPKRVVDLGCGPGNSTTLLRARWPDATIDGVDLSSEMLEDARASAIAARFIQADVTRWTPDAPYDVIYSNAAMQWMDDHEHLIPRLLSFLAPQGVLAVQVPRNFDEPCHRLIREAVVDPRWAEKLANVRHWMTLTPAAYYDLIAPRAAKIDIWEARYFHVLNGKDSVFHWMMGSSLGAFAAALESPLKEEFLEHCREVLARAYRPQPDGKTLFPFFRLHFVVFV